MQIGIYAMEVKKDKVLLTIEERRRRIGAAEIKSLSVEIDPVTAKSIGQSLITMAERADTESLLAGVEIPQEIHNEAREACLAGKRIEAVRIIRMKSNLGIREGLAYINKHFPLHIFG